MKPKLIAMLIAVPVLLSMRAWGQEQDLVIPTTTNEPKITQVNGEDRIVLPQALLERIRIALPGFRIPSRSDQNGPWAAQKQPGSYPFVSWGDFNGDGLTDVAIVLLSKDQWDFVIFHQTPTGFVVARELKESQESRAPQSLFLRTVKKGEIASTTSMGKKYRYRFDFDAIEFSTFEVGLSFLYWDRHTNQYELKSFYE